jgi:YVTN family beta-propeller protein
MKGMHMATWNLRAYTARVILALLLWQGSVSLRPVAADPAQPKTGAGTLVVAHKWDDSVGFYDPVTGAAQQTVPIGRKPHEMALSRDGKRAYVTLYGLDLYTEKAEGGRAVAVLDVEKRAKLGEIDLGKYRRPHGIEVGHRSGRLYVTCDHPAALLVLDPEKRAVESAIELPEAQSLPHMVAVAPDEKTAYVANSGTGDISVIDLEVRKEVKRLAIGGVPMGMALSADGKTLFATNRTANGVAVIDTGERKVRRVIEITGQPVRAQLTPDGRWLLATLIDSGELAVVDARELTLQRRLAVGQRVEGVTVDPAGRFGYASAQADNKVIKFSLSDWKPVLEIKTRERPDPLIVLPF